MVLVGFYELQLCVPPVCELFLIVCDFEFCGQWREMQVCEQYDWQLG